MFERGNWKAESKMRMKIRRIVLITVIAALPIISSTVAPRMAGQGRTGYSIAKTVVVREYP